MTLSETTPTSHGSHQEWVLHTGPVGGAQGPPCKHRYLELVSFEPRNTFQDVSGKQVYSIFAKKQFVKHGSTSMVHGCLAPLLRHGARPQRARGHGRHARASCGGRGSSGVAGDFPRHRIHQLDADVTREQSSQAPATGISRAEVQGRFLDLPSFKTELLHAFTISKPVFFKALQFF